MSGEEIKAKDFQFQNIQRVLSSSSSNQMTLIGWTIGFESAGLVGLFSIATSNPNNLDHSNGISSLGMAMSAITLLLFFVWKREHVLAEQYINQLKDIVAIPEKDLYSGMTAAVWRTVFGLSLLLWLAVSVCPDFFRKFLTN